MGGEDSGGGSVVLASLIDKAGEALYQDFQEIYGVNLIDMVREDAHPAEFLLLIRGLRPGSRFMSVMQGSEEFYDWDLLAYQMATLTDAVNYVTYAVISANSKRKPKAPKPAYRPKKGGRKANNAFAAQLQLAKNRKAKGG